MAIKTQVNKIYKTYLSNYIKQLFYLLKKGPARFVDASSIPVSQNYQGISHKDIYSFDNVVIKPPFCLQESFQEKYKQEFPNRESLESQKINSHEVGIVSAKNVSVVIPGYFPIFEGKIWKEVTASIRYTNIPTMYDLVDWLKFESKITFTKKKKIEKEAIYFLGSYPGNYFHWLIQMLPKMNIFENDPHLNSLPIILHQNAKEFVKESLEIAGCLDRVIFLEEGVYEFEQLHICTRIHSSFITYPSTIEWIKRNFVTGEKSNKKRRIYISRKDAKIRYITNEEELKPILEKYGFEILTLTDYSIKEKVEIFQEAEIIIGSAGSGFTHQVFANENTVVIEIFSDDHIWYHDYILAVVMNQKYGYLITSKDGQGLYVQPEKMKEIIELGLSQVEKTKVFNS